MARNQYPGIYYETRMLKPRSPGMRLQHALDHLAAEARIAIAEAEAFRACGHDAGLSLGRLVREHRQALGLSLDQLAARSGCTKSHLWEIEQDRSRNPTVRMLHGLSVGLGLPIMVLIRAALAEDGK